ncbi:MAG TPA: hypothetical protein VFQ54_06735, partial [Thermomicrobiales bacterium]|nr:hypothetical protein [Thermomicrobiales bacterium]
MNDALTHIARGLVDRHTFGVVMLVAIAAIGWRNRSSFRGMLADDDAFWRLTARLFVGSFVATAVWIAIFDDWIQLFSEPYRRTRDLSVDRVVADPIPTELRAITLILLAITIIATAAIVARHIGGYGLQIGALLLSITFWLILFIF